MNSRKGGHSPDIEESDIVALRKAETFSYAP